MLRAETPCLFAHTASPVKEDGKKASQQAPQSNVAQALQRRGRCAQPGPAISIAQSRASRLLHTHAKKKKGRERLVILEELDWVVGAHAVYRLGLDRPPVVHTDKHCYLLERRMGRSTDFIVSSWLIVHANTAWSESLAALASCSPAEVCKAGQHMLKPTTAGCLRNSYA